MVKTTLKDNPKQFSLSVGDANLIYFIQQHHQAIMAGVISNIATHMGYTVTEHTQFEVSPDMKNLIITEKQPESPIVKAL